MTRDHGELAGGLLISGLFFLLFFWQMQNSVKRFVKVAEFWSVCRNQFLEAARYLPLEFLALSG